jgi:transposase
MQTRECPRLDDNWRIPDSLWERFDPLLPRRQRRRTHPGRKPLQWRPVVDGIFYVLRTGCQWKAAPREFGSGSSLHRYFQLLVREGIFAEIWRLALEEYDELQGIEWEWQSIDGTMTKAPLGGEKNRPQSHRSRQNGNQAVAAYRWRRNPLGRRRQRCQHA